MKTETVDKHLDAVLRASGSALRHYSMQKTLDDMRAAMREAMACHSHDDLVAALEKLLAEADHGNPFCSIGHLIEHVVPEARAALAKAKGEA